MPDGVGYPFSQFGTVLVLSSQLLVPLRPLTGRMLWEAELCLRRAAQQQLKHWSVINIILILKSKHGTVTATMENISSMSVETGMGASLPVHVSASLETITLSHSHEWSPAYLWVERCGRDNVVARDFANLAAQGHEQSDPALVLALLLIQGWTGGFEWNFLVKIVLWNYYWM